ncbi:MAG TPA: hypothetical protein VFY99_03775 [Solirubrobacterales bacterium]
MSAPLLVVLVVLGSLAVAGFGPNAVERVRRIGDARRNERAARRAPERVPYDPGRERRAERKALELLRGAVGEDEYAMYASLGFLRVRGRARDGGEYGYLIYPHRPIVAYDAESGELLSEYCVGFPDRAETAFGPRLPDADDVLAKWMSLHGDERGLIADANMHLPGRQVDPGQVRRDLRRLRDWDARSGALGAAA